MPHKGTLWEHLNESYAAKQIAAYAQQQGCEVEPILERALIAFEQQHPDKLTISADTDINLLFTWSDTNEGHNYWKRINHCHP